MLSNGWVLSPSSCVLTIFYSMRVNSQRKLVSSGKLVGMLKGYQFYLLETSSVHLPLSTSTTISLAVDLHSKYLIASAAQGTDLSE